MHSPHVRFRENIRGYRQQKKNPANNRKAQWLKHTKVHSNSDP